MIECEWTPEKKNRIAPLTCVIERLEEYWDRQRDEKGHSPSHGGFFCQWPGRCVTAFRGGCIWRLDGILLSLEVFEHPHSRWGRRNGLRDGRRPMCPSPLGLEGTFEL